MVDAPANNLSSGTYAQRTARDPVSITGKRSLTPGKKGGAEIKVSRGVNLLSDTGLAVRRAQVKYWLTRASLLVIGISVVFTAGTFGFWYVADRQHRAVLNQISVLEQRLATLGDVENLARSYKNRLTIIAGLVNSGKEIHKPGKLEQEVSNLATNVEGTMTMFEYGGNFVKGTIEVADVGGVDKVLLDLKNREQEGLWSNVVISKFSRTKPDIYGVEFSASLVVAVPSPAVSNQSPTLD